LLGPRKIRRRAWWLIDDMNSCFSDPVIEARRGGPNGGGATLTQFGHRLIVRYRTIETEALAATKSHLDNLKTALKTEKVNRPQGPRSMRGI
jgi:molybdate transport system regulatory protein